MSERITPEKAEDVADRLHLERDGFNEPNMENPVYAAMTEAEFLLRVMVTQMKADDQRIAALEECEKTMELFMTMMDRAGRMWLKAHPEKKLMWPDGAHSIEWLLDQIDRLRKVVDEARKALYCNVECDCRETLTFDCWKCNLMRELNKVMSQTPPPAATAPSAEQ